MSPDTWSWIAAAASIVGLWISGSNPRFGWIYGIGCQGLYVAYGLATHQHGMIAMSFVFVGLYVRNIRRWSGTHFVRGGPESAPETAQTPARPLAA